MCSFSAPLLFCGYLNSHWLHWSIIPSCTTSLWAPTMLFDLALYVHWSQKYWIKSWMYFMCDLIHIFLLYVISHWLHLKCPLSYHGSWFLVLCFANSMALHKTSSQLRHLILFCCLCWTRILDWANFFLWNCLSKSWAEPSLVYTRIGGPARPSGPGLHCTAPVWWGN